MQSLSERHFSMIGFVLAAGFGTRLKPLTDHVPKALVPVCGVAVLQRQLQGLRAAGVRSIGVNCHHMADQLEAFRGSSPVDFRLFHEADRIRGTGGALWFARGFLGSDDTFCVVNVDIVTTLDLAAMEKQFLALDCAAALVAVPVVSGGTVAYNRGSLEFLGATQDRVAGPDEDSADFVGVALYRREFLSMLIDADFSIVPVWQRARRAGQCVKVIPTPGIYWRDVGTPQSYAQIHFDALDGTLRLDVPRRMRIDSSRHAAYPAGLDSAHAAGLGDYTWLEDDVVLCGTHRTVVLRGAFVDDAEGMEDAIFTPWGRIGLG
jgi:mannose-1-phosphate guanylyltransferase